MSTSATPSVRNRASIDITSVSRFFGLGGRILLASLFLLSGLTKMSAYGATAGYMTAMGVSPALLPLVIATEVLGSLAVIVGWNTRIAAFLLAGFTLIAGVIFHNNLGDQIQTIMLLKDVSIAGAFLLLVANGAGPLSLDHRRARSAAARVRGKS
jgi:putative oxidoreductase